MFHVKKMEISDFPFAVQVANAMNWNMSSEDFRFMMKLEPEGCFVLFQNLERLGIVTSISYGKVGWFGNLVVREDIRREGVGRILANHAISYLKNLGVETIGIYAYPHLVSFYENLGFERDVDFAVLKRKATFSFTEVGLQEAPKKNISKLIDFDEQYFGANRQKLLQAILLSHRNLCYISTENSKIAGYVTAKLYSKTAEVGPLVCQVNHEREAALLLESILARLNGVEVFIYIPKKETKLLEVLYKKGFIEDFRVARMFLGSIITNNCIYTAESLERG
jgi:GNAT superfamily N-acetyltransferase